MHSIINYDNEKPDVNSKVSRTSRKFLGTKFLQQMNRLVEELHSCDCHFVRCIKPNEMKKPHMFNSASVLQSLRNLGVLDSIRIRKLGYVYRRPFHEFYKKFY
jgi:myosin heavy subunit